MDDTIRIIAGIILLVATMIIDRIKNKPKGL